MNLLIKDGDKLNLKKTLKNVMYSKQFDKFNFYFSKPINEILCGVLTPEAILYKDLRAYDDTHEFLKRPYQKEEGHLKIKTMVEFYETYQIAQPKLCTVD